jgi:uncharacterized NAD(P)/FAD-binding protein YdhS
MAQSPIGIIIVGGGASGILLACHLLRDPVSVLRVTVIERRPEVGVGIAYGTTNCDHLLNVRAANMSAFADVPDHFWEWLSANGGPDFACPDPFCFVPRRVYGRYITSLIEPLLSEGGELARLRIVQQECVSMGVTDSHVVATLADGSNCVGDVAVLATGHEAPAATDVCCAEPWAVPIYSGLRRDAAVLILGTGLTMIDCVLSLMHEGHEGPIVAMSRRGLLPRAHRRIEPLRIDAADIPFGADIAHLCRWFRGLVACNARSGGDWRSVVDGVRPFSRRIWQSLSLGARRRFLEHIRPWWDVHRHRMAPEVEVRIKVAMDESRLTIIAGRICAVDPDESGARVRYRRRGETSVETVYVSRIVECRGGVANPLATVNPVLKDLFQQGLARVDPLGIGIEVTDDCAVIDHTGRASERLFAIGPLTRAAFWEIVAVPDIRVQCAELARRIVMLCGAQ